MIPMENTPQKEAEKLVDGVVDNGRSRIVEENEETIQNLVNALDNFREMNVVFSETRRRLDNE